MKERPSRKGISDCEWEEEWSIKTYVNAADGLSKYTKDCVTHVFALQIIHIQFKGISQQQQQP